MFRYIQKKYQFTDYQIAQLNFLCLTLFSELSKTFLIGILFIHELPIFIWCLLVFQLMRTSTGGIHFKRYVSCLCMSIFFFFMCIDILPLIPIDKTVELVLLVICAYISYIIGPVVSAVHLELSPESIAASKNRLMYVVFGYSVFLFIMPQYRFISVGFWVIIFNTVMLVIAKIKSQITSLISESKFEFDTVLREEAKPW